MNHVVSLDKDGHLVYKGLLTAKEIATADEILNALRDEITQIESDLEEAYGKTVLYRYHLGRFLGELLEKYDISVAERRRFWDEIKTLVTKETRLRDEGANSITRSFYQQCFVLSQLDLDTVQKLSARQWQDLLDRVDNREDERIFQWIKQTREKIREDDWREFEKGLHLYLKNKDTSVFSDEELFTIYNSILEMSKFWRISFRQFAKDFPKSDKIKSKARRSKKYQETCFKLKHERRCPLDEAVFSDAFELAMK
ncbi:MAG: ATP-dependent helicase [Clostridia bacterium]|nr:ATP-dependent helicase [Clostridia bacterium]